MEIEEDRNLKDCRGFLKIEQGRFGFESVAATGGIPDKLIALG